MIFFNKEKRKRMEFIQSYVPTSKAQLIQVAMMYCKGDLQKAQEMFDFYSKNLNLPDFDPVEPTFMQQVKQTAGGMYEWIKANQNEILNGYQLISTIIQNKGILPSLAADAEETAEELPDIN